MKSMSVYIKVDFRSTQTAERCSGGSEFYGAAESCNTQVFTAWWPNAARGKIKPLLWVASGDPRPRRLNHNLPSYAEHQPDGGNVFIRLSLRHPTVLAFDAAAR